MSYAELSVRRTPMKTVKVTISETPIGDAPAVPRTISVTVDGVPA